MPRLPPTRLISLALALSLTAGCAQFKSALRGGAAGQNDAYAQSDIGELLGFGASLANKPASARAETCRALLQRQKEAPSPGVQLHLMMGRTLSDACGDIPRILDGLDSPAVKNISDGQVRSLVAVQAETLQRMHSLSRRVGSLERRHKTVQTVIESKETAKGTKEPKEPKAAKDENRILREKLEAIRAMEKKMDESGEGN